MTPIDVAVSDRLHRAGFSIANWSAAGPDGSKVHQVTADGPLGRVDVAASTLAEAFAQALAEARHLLDLSG